MIKCMALLKVQLLSFWNINKVRHSNDPKEKKRLTFMLLMFGIIAVMLCANMCSAAFGYAMLGFSEAVPALMMTTSSIIIILSGFLYGGGQLVGSKDYDMVMSLPVSAGTIVISRFLSFYILDAALTLGIMIPSLVAYSYFESPSPVFYIVYIILTLFIPLIPMMAAAAIGVLIYYISSRFKYTNIISIVCSVILIAGIFLLSFNPENANDEYIIEIFKSVSEYIYSIYPLAYIFDKALSGSILMTAAFIVLSTGFSALCIYVFSRAYKHINNSILSHKAKSDYKIGKLNRSSALRALYHKELKRYIGSSIYFMNTFIGVIMLILFSGVMLFADTKQLGISMGLGDISTTVGKIAPFVASITVGMCCTTSSAISLEGKNLWILMSSPIDKRDIYKSKIIVNISITLPAVFISGIMLNIGIDMNAAERIMVFVMPALYTVYVAAAGLLINLRFPVFDWTNETQVIKQGASTFVAMLVEIFTALIPFALLLIFTELSTVIMAAFLIILAVLIILLYNKLKKSDINI